MAGRGKGTERGRGWRAEGGEEEGERVIEGVRNGGMRDGEEGETDG